MCSAKAQPKSWKAFHYIARVKTAQAAPKTPRLVLDSNTLFDWLVFGEPAACAVGGAVQSGSAQWLCSDALWGEWTHTLARPLASRWEAPRELALTNLPALRACPLFVAQPSGRAIPALRCRDADDQKFLDLALAHAASALLTRDKALLKLARRAAPLGVRITTPARWLVESPH